MSQQVLSSAGAIKESNSFGNAGYGTWVNRYLRVIPLRVS